MSRRRTVWRARIVVVESCPPVQGRGGGGWSGEGGYVVELMVQLYVFCPLSRMLSAKGSTPDSVGAHFEVGLR